MEELKDVVEIVIVLEIIVEVDDVAMSEGSKGDGLFADIGGVLFGKSTLGNDFYGDPGGVT